MFTHETKFVKRLKEIITHCSPSREILHYRYIRINLISVNGLLGVLTLSEAACCQAELLVEGSCVTGCARAGKLCFLRAVPATFEPRPDAGHSPF